ncbi:glycosyltransferase family A protein [Acidiphilium acidophilum]|uniref:glycosyltransferase family 2 protein n=1 Tax=Acidiphilium acidophilum TaxID=76588 RepID=UPI002E8E7861|nr:glycosyltransferase family A protein [Acidiphilium acidophilum]
MHIGVGVATYNRSKKLKVTLENILLNTPTDVDIVVADDGSSDDTMHVIEQFGNRISRTITGRNHGAAWNKNRLLFYLDRICRADVCIILEDDTYPISRDWESSWVDAASRLGHVAYAGPWFANTFVGGDGSAISPYESCNTTAQCAAFSSYALSYVGYMDSRFGKLGGEHVEHSMRFVRNRFGGYSISETEFTPMYYLLSGNFVVSAEESYFTDEKKISDSIKMVHDLIDGPDFRLPWSDNAQAAEFRSEIESSLNK